jgi:tRNA uridine 5-carboxymethylaminomethyl modification enzyme
MSVEDEMRATPGNHEREELSCDVIVVGGGHAGVEAAAAAARYGADTVLVTFDPEQIGAMSCNPAIGGLGKGHLVREIDALDGIMARAADEGGIQFRVLNRRKGPAVQGPRAQADRRLYAASVKRQVEAHRNLRVIAGEVVDLVLGDGAAAGVVLAGGRVISSGAVVITSGTFLRGMIFRGEERISAGRADAAPSVLLARRFEALGLIAGRLKTGTPARLDGRSIDWNALEMQPGDDPPEPFSSLTRTITNRQVMCGITRTTSAVHELIRTNLHRSAMYSGLITGRGPRYCPSIEDKVVRFADRESHQVFLEPEGLDDPTVYPNGISTSLPADIQERFIRLMPGLERVRILRAGYAIEYDHCDPTRLRRTLESRAIGRLFLAGQINGTTGYEEAAAQGLLAGLNAARLAGGAEMVAMERDSSYIGVMIDDLVTQGVTEPYRMFTSRSEYRLALRADNADLRLTRLGESWNIVGAERAAAFKAKKASHARAIDLLNSLSCTPNAAAERGFQINRDGIRRSAFALLSHPGIQFGDLLRLWPELDAVEPSIRDIVETDARYSVYLERQREEIERLRRDAGLSLEGILDYGAIPGLSRELQTKLSSIRPRNIAQAGRIDGMTPAALALLASRASKPAAAVLHG